MSEPCIQDRRLITLETILSGMATTLSEQKELGTKTYEVLASIALQGEQIRSLVVDTVTLKHDVELAWASIRRIDALHIKEQATDVADKRWKRSLIWVAERFTIPALMTLLFAFWLNDHFHFVQLWYKFKEYKG